MLTVAVVAIFLLASQDVYSASRMSFFFNTFEVKFRIWSIWPSVKQPAI
jgi:hypothetical protein